MEPRSAITRLPRPAFALPCLHSNKRVLAPILAVIAALFPALTHLNAQPSKASAGQVQAAYLDNFGKFVKWPAGAPANHGSAFVICVLDQDPFGDTLKSALTGESVDGRPVTVKRIAHAQDAEGCHILFISAAQAKDLGGILTTLDDSSILTVSDMPDFSKRGGMIQFVFEGDRVRFEINLESTEKSHLVLASELLKVAAAVRPARSGD
jgi:hypothetical protein